MPLTARVHAADVMKNLSEAVDQDLSLVVPVSDAIERLPLTPLQRRAAVDGMVQRISSIAACDVPDVTLLVLRRAQPGEHALKVCQVRIRLVVWRCQLRLL
jgi:hypothetical protein